jgi:hypothetical protein
MLVDKVRNLDISQNAVAKLAITRINLSLAILLTLADIC